MRNTVRESLAATILVAGALGLLGGCTAPASEQPVSPPAPQSSPADPIQPAVAADRVPLGLEVRYVDENGRFVTMSPENFPR